MATDIATGRPDRRVLLARLCAVVFLSGFGLGFWFEYLEARGLGTSFLGNDLFSDLTFVLTFSSFPIIGYLIATRRPEGTVS